MQFYCEYCKMEFESSADGVDHYPDGLESKCKYELEDDAMFRTESYIKGKKENAHNLSQPTYDSGKHRWGDI